VKDLGLLQYECGELWMFIVKRKGRHYREEVCLSLKVVAATSVSL